MIKKNATYRVSIFHRLIFWTLCFGCVGLLSLSISTTIIHDTTGSAHMINQLGLLRMKSYQLLAHIPLTTKTVQNDIFSDISLTDKQQTLLAHYHLLNDFEDLQTKWHNDVIDKIMQAQRAADVLAYVQQYVNEINALIYAIDQKTEQKILFNSSIQVFFIIIILLFLLIQFFYLRYSFSKPWKQLITMADAITHHNFSYRFLRESHIKDEFDLLGLAFNRMSDEIESQYQLLEQRVTEKTIELQQKNQIVMFLYNASKLLHTTLPVCERFSMILMKLETLIPLSHFSIRLYEAEDPEQAYHNEYKNPQSYCLNRNCEVCFIAEKFNIQSSERRYWYLQNKTQKYGVISAYQNPKLPLTEEQEDLVLTLLEQMTITLELERKVEQQKSYLLMKERSAIARELHDSIAQSLSCLKIHLSCLQMQSDIISQESKQLLKTMRNELNTTYSQLRELITTFRLSVNRTGFYASLHDLIKEFNQKLGFPIHLNYQLPLQLIDSSQAIHLLQIIREALNNIYKHAKASQVVISLDVKQQDSVYLTIEDNGIGLLDNWKKNEHYGLIIMRDRVELLRGYFDISSEPNRGTKIMVNYKIAADKLPLITPANESLPEEEQKVWNS
ncbi:MAG: nitrate/nitrite two-component system sensor histidine kinase NarX [Candidatus Schmidhempelia sp.]|nr:nitrate/nitrite two-component system sensor histidine kinase NarX [Candidatus Schmidhempelia sp.]